MNIDINNYLVHTRQTEWKSLNEEGIDTSGIFVKILRYDDKQQRPPSFILKFEPGSGYPYHNHPGGEELFVLKGSCVIEGVTLHEGDYLYTPPNFKHSVKTETGCELMFIVPVEVEIL